MICDGLWSSCVWFTLKDKIKIKNCIASVYGSGMTDDMYSHTHAFMHCGVLDLKYYI